MDKKLRQDYINWGEDLTDWQLDAHLNAHRAKVKQLTEDLEDEQAIVAAFEHVQARQS